MIDVLATTDLNNIMDKRILSRSDHLNLQLFTSQDVN